VHRLQAFALVSLLSGLGVVPAADAQNAVNCVRPWAIPDRWIENQTPGWDASDTFSRYVTQGATAGALVPSADLYVPAGAADPGSGYRLFDGNGNVADYGRQLIIKPRDNTHSPSAGWFNVVDVGGAGGGGGAYRAAITGCIGNPVAAGDVVALVNGNHNGPTIQGVSDLVLLDPTARWDPTAFGGAGGVVSDDFPGSASPRIVPVIFYDPDLFEASLAAGQPQVAVAKILGMFVEGLESKNVIGRLVTVPTLFGGN
jgi:hypothetical protein